MSFGQRAKHLEMMRRSNSTDDGCLRSAPGGKMFQPKPHVLVHHPAADRAFLAYYLTVG